MTTLETIDKTPKSVRTREHILETALHLFESKGYQETTLRDIAAAAGSSLGLTYRYFSRKEELVIALYERLTGELEEEVRALPPGPMAKRFAHAMRADLARMGPHRAALAALFGAGLLPDSEVAVLGDRVEGIRARVCGVYLAVITGATDAPKKRVAEHLAILFYAAHLSLVLFWLQDRSPGQRATEELLDFGADMIARLRPALILPLVAKSVARLARILTPMFGPLPESI